MCVAGMSNTPCDRAVLLNDYISPQENLDKTYMYTGPSGRLSNEYIRLANGTFVELSASEQGELTCTSQLYSLLILASN